MKGGFVGVDVFFVISGYLIGTHVHNEIRDGSFSIAKFYKRRAKRILPALFAVLLFSYVMALLLLSPMEMKMFSGSALGTITSSSNVFFFLRTNDYFAPNAELSPLLMTWSLGIEEQFYILFPLLMLLMRKQRWQVQFWGIGGLGALSLVASIWGTTHHPAFTFYMLPTRAWELAAGVLLGLFEVHRRQARISLPPVAAHSLSVLGLGLIAVAIGVLDRKTPFPGYAALLPVLGAVLIIAAREGVINRILSWQPLVFVGLVSYSWYLWHWPMLSFARIASPTGISTPVGVSIGLLSFGCAVLSYYFVERPFRKSTTPTTSLLFRYGALAAVMMVPAAVFHLTNGLPQRNRGAQRLDMASQELSLDKCLVEEPTVHPPLKAPCVPYGQGPAVALIGDSHAAQLAGALRKISTANGYRLVELTKGNCQALGAGVTRSIPGQPEFAQHCTQFNRERLAYVVADPNIKVVIIAGFWSDALEYMGEFYPANVHAPQTSLPRAESREPRAESREPRAESRESLERGLNEVVRQLSLANKTIYLVQDNPVFAVNPVLAMKAALIKPRHALASLVASSTLLYQGDFAPEPSSPRVEDARLVIARVSAENPNVHLIDLQRALCTGDSCRFADGDQSLYMDANHLSSLGAQIAVAGLRLP